MELKYLKNWEDGRVQIFKYRMFKYSMWTVEIDGLVDRDFDDKDHAIDYARKYGLVRCDKDGEPIKLIENPFSEEEEEEEEEERPKRAESRPITLREREEETLEELKYHTKAQFSEEEEEVSAVDGKPLVRCAYCGRGYGQWQLKGINRLKNCVECGRPIDQASGGEVDRGILVGGKFHDHLVKAGKPDLKAVNKLAEHAVSEEEEEEEVPDPVTIVTSDNVYIKNPKGHQEDEPEWFMEAKEPYWDENEGGY